MSQTPNPQRENEKSPSAFQPPNHHRIPSSPVGDENPPAVPAKESPPPTSGLKSQTPVSTTASHARPGTPDFFLANSNYSMPGAYPTTPDVPPSPLASDPRTQPAETSLPYTPKRDPPSASQRTGSTGSIRALLANLRRPSSNTPPKLLDEPLERSPPIPTIRPMTPSQSSMASSSKPLRKKMSGSFWTRRKSSLGVEVMMDAGGQGRSQDERSIPSTPNTAQNGHSTSPQNLYSPSTPKDSSEGGSIMNSIRKRRSGTFWGKRKTSLGTESKPSLDDAGPDKVFQGHARVTSTASGPSSVDQSPPQPLRKKKSASFWKRKPSMELNRAGTATHFNGLGLSASPTQPINEDIGEDRPDVRMSEADSYVHDERPRSPPPVLPELNLGLDRGSSEGFLADADDMFAKIGKD